MTVILAKALTGGGLTKVSKMPEMCYNLPAQECKVGGRMRAKDRARKAQGLPMLTPCGHCYVFSRQFAKHSWNVYPSHYARLATITGPHWVEAMAFLIARQSPGYFRWHSAGDLQSVDHLQKIVEVCRLTPGTRHWLPTQERGIVRQWRQAYGKLPENLTVRISATRLGSLLGTYSGDPELTSSLVTSEDVPGVRNCPARHQGNVCGDCRACWDRTVPTVAYHRH